MQINCVRLNKLKHGCIVNKFIGRFCICKPFGVLVCRGSGRGKSIVFCARLFNQQTGIYGERTAFHFIPFHSVLLICVLRIGSLIGFHFLCSALLCFVMSHYKSRFKLSQFPLYGNYSILELSLINLLLTLWTTTRDRFYLLITKWSHWMIPNFQFIHILLLLVLWKCFGVTSISKVARLAHSCMVSSQNYIVWISSI